MTTIMIVVTELMKEKSATPNTRPALHKSSPVKTSSVFVTNTGVTEKMTAVTIQMRWGVKRKITPAQKKGSSSAQVDSALTANSYATRFLIAPMIVTNRYTATSTNVPKLRFINVVTSVSTLLLHIIVNAIMDTSKLFNFI